MSEPGASGLELIVRCLDLTSLEDDDTTERITALCERAVRPDPDEPLVPPVAAVCVHGRFAGVAVERLRDTDVRVAAVAGAFPSGVAPLAERVREIREALDAGATEIDTVLDHRALREGRVDEVRRLLSATREATEGAVLKVILETGELGVERLVRQASELGMETGADFLKSSTGKTRVGASPEAARWMLEAVRDHRDAAGREVGVKLSGGIRTPAVALAYASLLGEVVGPSWLRPERFRIGASSLLDDLVEGLRRGRGSSG